MRRVLVLAMLVSMTLGIFSPGSLHAQSTAWTGIPVGTAVSIFAVDRSPMATVTVSSVTDPFVGYDASTAPQPGEHYAAIEVTIANVSNAPIQVKPSYFFAFSDIGVSFPSAASIVSTDPAVTPLQDIEALAPGTSASGAVVFTLAGDTAIGQVAYLWDQRMFSTVLDLRTTPVAVGTPVDIWNATGDSGNFQVTINSVTAPFTDYVSSAAPPAGSSYLALDVTFTNTGPGDNLTVYPPAVQVIDQQGSIRSRVRAERRDTTVADLSTGHLKSGESVRGVILYEMLDGVPAAQVQFSPGNAPAYLNILADLSSGNGATASTGTTGSGTASVSCAGVAEWSSALLERGRTLDAAVKLPSGDDWSGITVNQVTSAAALFRTAGDEQAASNPPAVAADLNNIMVQQLYYPLASALDGFAAAIQGSDDVAAETAWHDVEGIISAFGADNGPYRTAVATLSTACPAEAQVLVAPLG